MAEAPRSTGVRVAVHCRWNVTAGSPRLTEKAVERLVPYITRYAQTLGVIIYAVGGTAEHLHVLLELPPRLSLQHVTNELLKPTARFLNEVMALQGFAWDAEDICLEAVSPWHVEQASAHIVENWERHGDGSVDPLWEFECEDDADSAHEDAEQLPDWLRNILPATGDPEEKTR